MQWENLPHLQKTVEYSHRVKPELSLPKAIDETNYGREITRSSLVGCNNLP